MEHVVFFPASDGTPAFRRFAGIDEAVRFVEHLRNVENVSSASVYSLTEVPLSFKAWYRVEVPGEPTDAPNASADQPAAVTAAAAVAGEAPAADAGPATIAEAIESYSLAEAPGVPSFEMPDQGSATGIVVPDQPLVAVDQFAMPAPGAMQATGALSAPTVLPVPDQQAPTGQPAVTVAADGDAQVFEPAFGARRERGIGFFAR